MEPSVSYVFFIFHTQTNFNCKKRTTAVVLVISKVKSLTVAKNVENAPAQVLTQLPH